ncbi:leucine-rich repeat and coiled-coil domain-containing protein 1 [Spea bombifrons]|uniref:leucine-rich repeat and coiled-coil domain-containing protein 1 n=1 Tax=Spea bombifrons TaxID=233779 RepID=UPI00234A76B5|nr:leucine-rich repeat and coiled-coil domain-containing protein 1 [Spea bombifrons]
MMQACVAGEIPRSHLSPEVYSPPVGGRKMAERAPESRELSLMDKQVSSLLEISLDSSLLSINLHCNQLSRIEGLEHLHHLQHLDLSSNLITRIEGLGSLKSLCTLNLSCNKLSKIEGLQGLINLKELNLSYNHINDITGLMLLSRQSQKLKRLYLHSNCISDIEQVIHSIVGLQSLFHLTLEQNGKGNPVCCITGYRDVILERLPHLKTLDGKDRRGELVFGIDTGSADFPSLDFLEYLTVFDVGIKELKDSTNVPVATQRIDEVLSQYRKRPVRFAAADMSSGAGNTSSSEREEAIHQDALHELRIKKLEDEISVLLKKAHTPKSGMPISVTKAKRDTDLTTESDCESGKENQSHVDTRRSRIPAYCKNSQVPNHRPNQQPKAKILNSAPKRTAARKQKSPGPHNRKDEIQSSASSDRVDTSSMERTHVKLQTTKTGRIVPNPTEESTYRMLVQELDQERERRWKAEQLVVKLTENLEELQCQAKEEKDINSVAVYTTDRLKELLLREKSEKSKLQGFVHHLKEENEKLKNELEKFANKEADFQKALKTMEDTLSKLETQRAQQQTLHMKQIKEAERRASASQREVDLLRVSVRQQKDKVHQLHELLTAREQAHRKELESRVALYRPEFQEAVAKEVAKEECRHSEQINEYRDKMNGLTQQYADLEDEFRAALFIEAGRFKEVKDGFDSLTAELAEYKEALASCQLKEKKSASLVQELTTLVKEQKARIMEVTKAKQEATGELKKKSRTLEMVAEEEKHKTVQIELLKQEKSKLISQLTAQESLIDGLKAERKIWGEELTQQGVTLAQDRGRLEAKIEVLSNELETLRKQNERDNDALRIKTKVVDDQTETIRKLKEGLQERDERIRKLREENIRAEKALQEQSDEKASQLEELKEKLERQTERKEEVKQLLEEKDAELEDVKKAYSAMNKKWQDKAELLSQLETQVRQMKENFDAKEKKLIEERDKSLQTQKALTEKLRSVDDAFRQQLESLLATHQGELTKLASGKQREIEAANERVYQVEEEMRQLLQETAKSKKAMEEKIKRLSSNLKEIQQDL